VNGLVKIQVLNYNVRMMFPSRGEFERAHFIRSFLSQSQADVIGLCEVYLPSLKQILIGNGVIKKNYPFSTDSFGNNSFPRLHAGLSLVSKYPIIRSEVLQFNNVGKIFFPFTLYAGKGVLFAELDCNGTRVGVFLTHLQWGNTKHQRSIRKLQLQELRQFIVNHWTIDKPTILMGDFNLFDNNHDGEYGYMRETLPGLVDVWSELYDISEKPGYTWNVNNTTIIAPMKNYRYDYILTSENIHPISCKIKKPNTGNISKDRKKNTHLHFRHWLWYYLSSFFTVLFFPVIVTCHLVRFILGLPVGLFGELDLSDHYAVEGIVEIKGI